MLAAIINHFKKSDQDIPTENTIYCFTIKAFQQLQVSPAPVRLFFLIHLQEMLRFMVNN